MYELIQLVRIKKILRTRLLGRIYTVGLHKTMLSHFIMKQNLKMLLLGLCVLGLSGCNFLEFVKQAAGVYSGKNSQGLSCEVRVDLLDVPSGLCQWVSVRLKSQDKEQVKGFCVGRLPTYQPTQLILLQGDLQNPKLMTIDRTTRLTLRDYNIKAIRFTDSDMNCSNLQRQSQLAK